MKNSPWIVSDGLSRLSSISSPAAKLRSQDGGWFLPFVGKEGMIDIAPSTSYKLAEFCCSNDYLFSKNALARLNTMQSNCNINVAAIKAYAFNNITILPHGVIHANNNVVSETLIPLPNNDHYIAPISNYLEEIDNNFALNVEYISNKPVLIIDQPGIFNYGHWLIEIFPKIWVFIDNIRAKQVSIALPAQFRDWGFINSMLNFLDVDTDDVVWYDLDFRNTGAILKFDKALYISPISKHPFPGYVSPWSIYTLSQITSYVVPWRNRKIFVSRGDAPNRYLVNEREIFSQIRQLGYEFVQTATMSFPDQVSLFRSATHVIGVYGASMTNVCFCQPSAKIFTIAPNYHIDHFYWDLLSIKGIDYHYFNGSAINDDENNPFRDFEVKEDELLAEINRFEHNDRNCRVLHQKF